MDRATGRRPSTRPRSTDRSGSRSSRDSVDRRSSGQPDIRRASRSRRARGARVAGSRTRSDRNRGRVPYLDLVERCEASVQVGDLGDAEIYATLVEQVDPTRHRFIPGKHDDYDHLPRHSLGDFGEATLGGVEFSFVRGAASVDRRAGIPWWPAEELDDRAMSAALEAYLAARPGIVISHDAPSSVAAHLIRAKPASRTSGYLERMFQAHAPRLWFFGHYHESWTRRIGGTQFRCLDELEPLDLDPGRVQ